MEEKQEVQKTERTSADDTEDDVIGGKRSHLHFDDPMLKQVEETTKVTTFIYFATFMISIGGFLFGYDTGVISSAMLLLENDFTMTALQKGMVVGATTFGAIIGGLGSGSFSDIAGRRITSVVASVTFIGGALVLSLASTYELLLFGRLVVGIAAGASSHVVPIYISEISPRFYRGRLVTMNIVMCTGGQLFAYLVATGLVFPGGWRWMFGISGIPAVIQSICMTLIPESPRHLVRKGKSEQARKILSKIYPGVHQHFLSQEIEIIRETIAQDAAGSYKQLIKYPNFEPLIISCGLQLFQQLSGFDTAMYYGATIMKMAGFTSIKDAIYFSILVSGTNFIVTGIALFLIDKVGRRRILLYTMVGTTIGLGVLGIGFALITGFTIKQNTCFDYGNNCGACIIDDRCGFSIDSESCVFKNQSISAENGNLYLSCPSINTGGSFFTLVSLVIFVASYALGLGHVPWTVQSELFPLSVRGRAVGIATATNWLVNLGVALSFLPLTEAITISGTFWMYAIFMIVGWIFVYTAVPETTGKSLEEIRELFLR